jgi:hypothetical protein
VSAVGKVEYLDDEPNGLAMILGGLIEGNLDGDPGRAKLLSPPAVVGVVAADADAAVTLRLAPARVTVTNGLVGFPDVVVRTDSETLTELSSVPLRLGFPDATKEEGRAITRKLLRGELKVKGLARHPILLSRLNRLLSVV